VAAGALGAHKSRPLLTVLYVPFPTQIAFGRMDFVIDVVLWLVAPQTFEHEDWLARRDPVRDGVVLWSGEDVKEEERSLATALGPPGDVLRYDTVCITGLPPVGRARALEVLARLAPTALEAGGVFEAPAPFDRTRMTAIGAA
jgi:hypothetical protein